MTQSINNNISIIDNSNSCIEIEELDCSIPHIPNCNETQFHSCFPSQQSLPQNPISIPDSETLFENQKIKIKRAQIKNEIQNNKPKSNPKTYIVILNILT